MESSWKEYIDVLAQAPMAVILLTWMYLNNKKTNSLIQGYEKIIKKLIDKMK